MNFKKILRYILTLAVVFAAVYFFYVQFKKNADAISAYNFSVNLNYIFIAFIVVFFALLSGPLVWRIYVNDYLHKKLSIFEGFALYCTSTMFKYVPGKIWTYAAQIALMSSKEISNAVLIYINLVCFICLAFVAAMYTLFYYLFCLQILPWGISVLIFCLLIILDSIFIIWNNAIINYMIVPINRMFKIEIQPIETKRIIFIYTHIIYSFAYFLLGIGMYLLAKGINMDIPLANIFAIMATISVAAIAGYLAFFSIGGLGVREGAMFFMLKQFSNIETALILPVAARLSITIVELFMVIVAIFIGVKYGYFPKLTKNLQKEVVNDVN
ncbi:MAG: lysylphosphatidylglycerol synthase domain-containing protein [Deltaproteobacteria bacterium]|nr:lysylphosphatidylglycerol synthase domain-containing protein [Deltaproteobacteria bacterium]